MRNNNVKTQVATTDGCLTVYDQAGYSGRSSELCVDNYDLSKITGSGTGTSSWKTGSTVKSIKLGKHVTAIAYQSAKYQGKQYEAKISTTSFASVGFKANPGALKIIHTRVHTDLMLPGEIAKKAKENLRQKKGEETYNVEGRKNFYDKNQNKYRPEPQQNNENVRLQNTQSNFNTNNNDLGMGNLNNNDLGSGHLLGLVNSLQARLSNLERNQGPMNGRLSKVESSQGKPAGGEVLRNRIETVEERISKMESKDIHPVVACWNSVIQKPGDTLLANTLMIWNRTQFNKDIGHYKLSDNRTTVEVLKKGLYRIDAKVTTNSGSNIQAILNINSEEDVRFNASSSKGNTDDATLVYYKDLSPNDHISVFIASTGSGPNNIQTKPMHRFCIRKIE